MLGIKISNGVLLSSKKYHYTQNNTIYNNSLRILCESDILKLFSIGSNNDVTKYDFYINRKKELLLNLKSNLLNLSFDVDIDIIRKINNIFNYYLGYETLQEFGIWETNRETQNIEFYFRLVQQSTHGNTCYNSSALLAIENALKFLFPNANDSTHNLVHDLTNKYPLVLFALNYSKKNLCAKIYWNINESIVKYVYNILDEKNYTLFENKVQEIPKNYGYYAYALGLNEKAIHTHSFYWEKFENMDKVVNPPKNKSASD